MRLEEGDDLLARKLVLATGVVDELPETPGFRELWGRGVYHCPYCHGWEVRDRPIAVFASRQDHGGPVGRTLLIRNWSRDLVLLTDGPSDLDAAEREKLVALGVPLNEKRIARLEGKCDGSEGLSRILFEDGSFLEREGLFYVPPQRQRSALAETLGCEVEAIGSAAAVVKADPMTGETSVPGVFVAGDAGAPVCHHGRLFWFQGCRLPQPYALRRGCRGGGVVEAYPEQVEGRPPQRGSYLHTGPETLFEEFGFTRDRRIAKWRWVMCLTVAT